MRVEAPDLSQELLRVHPLPRQVALEVLDGIKDHCVRDIEKDPEDTRWEYTYHQRLFTYQAPGVEEIYDQIDRLETTEITTESYMEYDERYRLLVLPALGLLLLETLLLGTRFRKLP